MHERTELLGFGSFSAAGGGLSCIIFLFWLIIWPPNLVWLRMQSGWCLIDILFLRCWKRSFYLAAPEKLHDPVMF